MVFQGRQSPEIEAGIEALRHCNIRMCRQVPSAWPRGRNTISAQHTPGLKVPRECVLRPPIVLSAGAERGAAGTEHNFRIS